MASVVPISSELGEMSATMLQGLKRGIQRAGEALHDALGTGAMDGHSGTQELRCAVQRAGRSLGDVLNAAPDVNLSAECRAAIEEMAESGKALELRFVEELHNAGALTDSVKDQASELQAVSTAQLAEMRAAIAACTTAALASQPAVELMALWSVVHTSVSDTVSEQAAALSAKAAEHAPEALEAVEDMGEHAAAIGKLLLTALSSSAALVASISEDLRSAINQLAEAGEPLAENLAAELKENLSAVRDALPTEAWQELRSRCAQSLVTEWQALGDAAEELGTATKTMVGALQITASEVFNSPLAKAIAVQGLAGLEGALGETRESVDAALDAILDGGAAALGACAACIARSGLPPLLRVEIARDFFQTVGLFFAGLYATILDFFKRQHVASMARSLINALRTAYDVMAVNLTMLMELAEQNRAAITDIAVGVLVAVIGAVYLSYLWFAVSARHLHRRADEVRQGHEALTWAALAAKQKMRVKLFTYVITACLTVYLPVTRLCLDVIKAEIVTTPLETGSNSTVDSSSPGEDKPASASDLVIARFKGNASLWPVVIGLAVLILVTFTLPLPFLLVRAINENRPTGSLENPLVTHDLDGEEVPFDDKVYARLVARDPSQLRCPYRSLYAGFEQRWRHYKVLQLLVKFALVVVLVSVAGTDNRLLGVLSSIIYASVVALTSYSTPFSDPLNNVMEITAKAAALTTCMGGALTAFVDTQGSTSKTLELVAVIVSIVNLVNLFVMAVVLLLGMRGARLFMKNQFGWITFSDTSRVIQDAPAKDVVPNWDLEKEAKHRVWQAFWRAALLDLAQYAEDSKAEGDGKGDGTELTVAHRLDALEQAVVASGIRRVRSHWRGEEHQYTSQLRRAARAALEGVDVFWDDASGARDGHLDSQSCFGKMYVVPYPFHCVVVYDDSKDEAIVRDNIDDESPTGSSRSHCNLAKLLFLNFTPRIVAKRGLRQKLRALSARATKIHFPFSREEAVTVEDGTYETTDSQGNKTTHTRYTRVRFTCYYTRGVLNVATHGGSNGRIMAEGFNVSMTYKDGWGDATAPHTGKVHHIEDRVAVMGPEHVGLTPAMEESEQLGVIFKQTRAEWEAGVENLQVAIHQYRRALDDKHLQANATLSDAFWYFVYNNPRLPRDELESHLARREGNPRLQSLAETHAKALDALYLRLNFVLSHPAVTLWYIFWEDVYSRNGEMKRLKRFASDFDPRQSTAICYHVMPRNELEAWLGERKLLARRSLFHPRLLKLLYDEMDRLLGPAVHADGSSPWQA